MFIPQLSKCLTSEGIQGDWTDQMIQISTKRYGKTRGCIIRKTELLLYTCMLENKSEMLEIVLIYPL